LALGISQPFERPIWRCAAVDCNVWRERLDDPFSKRWFPRRQSTRLDLLAETGKSRFEFAYGNERIGSVWIAEIYNLNCVGTKEEHSEWSIHYAAGQAKNG